MPARRKSTAELDRRGAFEKNPSRGRERMAEPKIDGELGPPPNEFLSEHSPTAREHLRAWNELLIETKEIRLTSADRTFFIAICRLKVRTGRPTARSGDFSQLLAYLGRMGLTPVDRSRVAGKGKQTADEDAGDWDEMARGGDGLSRVQ